MLLLLIVIGATSLTAQAENTAYNVCEHGRAYIDECENQCTCLLNGGYACTLRACIGEGRSEVPMSCEVDGEVRIQGQMRLFCKGGILNFESVNDPDSCTPGTSWKYDCNTCSCGDDGKSYMCTKKACVTDLNDAPNLSGNSCVHGAAFIDQCDNDCNCINGDFYGCTRKACKERDGGTYEQPMSCNGAANLPQRHSNVRVFCHNNIVKIQPKEEACIPGSEYMNDCNQCSCSSTGIEGCTRRFCINEDHTPAEPSDYSSCDHGPAFIDQCNNDCTCMSGPTGSKYGCTRMACREGISGTNEQPMSCNGTDQLPQRNSNVRVYCHDNIVKFHPKAEACVPGSVFMNDCNECFCSNTGVEGCTLKLCINSESKSVAGNSCVHGAAFIDQCDNDCNCINGDFYGCTRKACKERDGGTYEQPMSCNGAANLPQRHSNVRVFCHNNIVKIQPKEEACIPGSEFMNDCNQCSCSSTGIEGCTRRFCINEDHTPAETQSMLLLPNCDGKPSCPADCGQVEDPERQCMKCQCGHTLRYGDVTVGLDVPCPTGLEDAEIGHATRSCSAQDCEPGSEWTLDDGCTNCTCLKTGEPACGPCQRQPTADTLTCEGYPECPADCGRKYDALKDCYECPCGVGEEGDTIVSIRDSCPLGTATREHGWATKACAPHDQLPQGDTRLCEGQQECPADCGLVRLADEEGCIYCQCGPQLAPGDVLVGHEQPCPSGFNTGEVSEAGKVCVAPNKNDCTPGVEFDYGCDSCLCMDSGVAACTKRDCGLIGVPTPTPPTSSDEGSLLLAEEDASL